MGALEAIAAAIAREKLLAPGERVLVALSGGPDSILLLHALHELGYCVGAAHLDHGMREGSAADADWVAAHCAQARIPCTIERLIVAPASEEAAREARYAFLFRVAIAGSYRAIALGHQADDQAETLLFRLARGTGIAGLGGIAPRREARVPLVRPLLDLTRREVIAALEGAGLPWLEDPSNLKLDFARNRLRSRVLPELEAVNTRAVPHRARLASLAREESAAEEELDRRLAKYFMRTPAPGLGELDRPTLLALPLPRRRRMLRLLVEELEAMPWDADTIELALAIAEHGGSADLPGGWRVSCEKEVLVLDGPGETPTIPFNGPGPQPTQRWGWRIEARSGATSRSAGPLCVRFDPAALPGGLGWRSARPETDRFQPWGHRRIRSLRHFLSACKVPLRQQSRLLVLADAEEVFWVVGLR
ncbi:MAG TPA: tRNA lysidine(34) synthetase TilS, partial [Oscillatoriaceae cyanobacterium]